MIDSEAVQDCRIEIVDGHGITNNVITEVIGLADGLPTFDSTTSQPDREAARMMVAAIVVGSKFSLRVDCASEFAAPDN